MDTNTNMIQVIWKYIWNLLRALPVKPDPEQLKVVIIIIPKGLKANLTGLYHDVNMGKMASL